MISSRKWLCALYNISLGWTALLPLFGYALRPEEVVWHLFGAGILLLLGASRVWLFGSRSYVGILPTVTAVVVIHLLLMILFPALRVFSTPLLMGLVIVTSYVSRWYVRTHSGNPPQMYCGVFYTLSLMRRAALLTLVAYPLLSLLPLSGRAVEILREALVPCGAVAVVWMLHVRRSLRSCDSPAARAAAGSFSCRAPLVRIALVKGASLFLCRSSACPGEAVRYDLPFMREIPEGDTPRAVIERVVREEHLPAMPRYLLRYLTPCATTDQRLVYLYVCDPGDGSDATTSALPSGKFWSLRSIRRALDTETFDPVLREEVRYIFHTVLMAKSIVANASPLCED